MTDVPLLRDAIDWGRLAPLRLRARAVAEGVYAGAHRSRRRGPGVEFGGHRMYVPGDDLRFLDRRATMRHGKLFVREFETETDRGLRLIVDASSSMGYRSADAPCTKFAFAGLVGAALARVVIGGADTVSLDWIGGADARSLGAAGGMEAFDRIADTLEATRPAGDVLEDPGSLDRTFELVSRRARRGSVVVLLSDFLDLPDIAEDRLGALASRGRLVVGLRVLDPAEANFPFEGPVRLRSSEGGKFVETEAGAARAGYLRALAGKMTRYREKLIGQGGRFVEATTLDDPVAVVQKLLAALDGQGDGA